MEKLKRLRLCRAVVSLLLPLTAIPVWLLPAVPAMGQAAPPPPAPPPVTAPAPGTEPAPPAPAPGTEPAPGTGAGTNAAPPPAPAPGGTSAATGGGLLTPNRVGLHSLLVWPFDVSRVAPDDPSIGILAEEDVVSAFVGNNQWQAAALRPSVDEYSPAIKRAITENAGSGDLKAILDKPGQPTPQDAETVAHTLGYDAVMIGGIDAITDMPARRTATAEVHAIIYDARDPAAARVVGDPLTARGTSGVQPATISAATRESMALQDAARNLVQTFAPVPKVVKPPTKKPRGGRAINTILPILLGIGAIAAIAVLASNSGGGNKSTPTTVPVVSTFGAPQNAVATLQGGAAGGFSIGLQFTANAANTNVRSYVISRTNLGGATATIDTIPAQGAGPTFQTIDPTVVPGQTYSYTVQAVGLNGQTSSSVPFVFTGGSTSVLVGQPAPPSNLAAQFVGVQPRLSWTPSPDVFVAGYQLSRSLNPNGPFIPIIQVAATSYMDSDPTLQQGQTYYYAVRALSNSSPVVASPYSNIAAVAIPTTTR